MISITYLIIYNKKKIISSLLMKDVPLEGSDEKSQRKFLTAALANNKEELLFNFIQLKVTVDNIGRKYLVLIQKY